MEVLSKATWCPSLQTCSARADESVRAYLTALLCSSIRALSVRDVCPTYTLQQLANLVMEHVETSALSTFPHKVLFWKRYVDDVCCSVNSNLVDTLLQHLNSFQPSIQFTHELEKDGCLPFLDVLLSRRSDGTVQTSVYWKETHTDRYLNFYSHHPTLHKSAVVQTLRRRATTHSSNNDLVRREIRLITEVLQRNDYPRRFLNCILLSPASPRQPDDSPEYVSTIVLPYVRGLSDAVKRICSGANIRVTFTLTITPRQRLVRVKDSRPPSEMSGVVYCVPCSNCCKVHRTNISYTQGPDRRTQKSGQICSDGLVSHGRTCLETRTPGGF